MAKAPKTSKKTKRPAKKSALKKALRGDDTHIVYIKGTTNLTPQQGITTSNYIYQLFSPSPQYLQPQQACPLFALGEFSLWRNIYDKFRVHGMGITIKPRYNQADMTQLINRQNPNETAGAQTEGTGTYFSTIDNNGWCPSSIVQLKKYGSTQIKRVFQGMTRGYNVKYASNQWLNCKDPAGNSDMMTSIGLNGGITIYGESLPEVKNAISNPMWADVEVTYKVEFKGKVLSGLFQEQLGGGLVGVTLTPHDAIPNLAPTPAFVIDDLNPHYGSVDLSGSTIDYVA